MTFQCQKNGENVSADLMAKLPHFFKIILADTLRQGKLVRILSSLSLGKNHMLINVDLVLFVVLEIYILVMTMFKQIGGFDAM